MNKKQKEERKLWINMTLVLGILMLLLLFVPTKKVVIDEETINLNRSRFEMSEQEHQAFVEAFNGKSFYMRNIKTNQLVIAVPNPVD